jgi:hypothetical protein
MNAKRASPVPKPAAVVPAVPGGTTAVALEKGFTDALTQLTDFTVDPGSPARLFGNVSVNGQLAAASAPLSNLDGSTLKSPTMDANGSAVLQGTTVKLAPRPRRC